MNSSRHRPGAPRFAPRIAAILCLGLAALVGCESAQPVHRTDPLPPAQGIPSYSEIARRHNARLAGLDRLWARADLELTWFERDGRRRFESADDSRLILSLPDRLALSVGKLGHEVLWAGHDDQRYWVFDLGEAKTLYVGRHEGRGDRAGAAFPLGLPVRPRDLTRLLGLMPIDPDRLPPSPRVLWLDGRYVIEPPGMGVRVSIDPVSFHARRVDLLNEAGASVLFAELSDHAQVRQHKKPDSSWPWAPRRADLTPVGRPDRVTLLLWDMKDCRRERCIKDAQFDLEVLTQAYEPARVVDLDEEPRGQAGAP